MMFKKYISIYISCSWVYIMDIGILKSLGPCFISLRLCPKITNVGDVNINLKFFWTCRNTISIVVKFLTQQKIVVKFPC